MVVVVDVVAVGLVVDVLAVVLVVVWVPVGRGKYISPSIRLLENSFPSFSSVTIFTTLAILVGSRKVVPVRARPFLV